MAFLIVILLIVLGVALVLGIRRYATVSSSGPPYYYSSPAVYNDDDYVPVGLLAAEVALDIAIVAGEIADEIAYEEEVYDSFGDD